MRSDPDNSRVPVALIRHPEYAGVREAVEEALRLLAPLPDFSGRTVLLKVNLMKGTPPGRALNTHPDFVAACARAFRDRGAEVTVGDSSGILGHTMEAFEASGIGEAARGAGARLANFDACRMVEVPLPETSVGTVWLPRMILETDYLVTLPKLKTHTLMGMTGAVKNQVGALPGGSKCRIHRFDPRPDAVARVVVALNRVLRPALGIVDGIWGIEGGGSADGRRRTFGVVAAGPDLVALDTVLARVMGLDPSGIPTIRLGAQLGLGTADESRIEIRGETLEACRSVCAAAGRDWKGLPVLGSLAYRLRGSAFAPKVEKARCRQCRTCAEVCPVGAVSFSPYPRFGRTCMYCFACYENCPERAIRLECRWYLRTLAARRAEGLHPSLPRGEKETPR